MTTRPDFIARAALRELPGGFPAHPCDLDELVERLGARLRYVRGSVIFDGRTDFSNDRPEIQLGWVHPTNSHSLLAWDKGARLSEMLPHEYDARTRFTLAHEIGHVLLVRMERRTGTPIPAEVDVERVCDHIAAETLMPVSWFMRHVGTEANLQSLRRTSNRARTSLSSTIVRARQLRYPVAALMLRSEGGAWRIRCSYGVAVAGWRFTRRSHDCLNSVPFKSIAADVHLQVACCDHHHWLESEVRRAGMGAVAVVRSVDGVAIRFDRTFVCPRAAR